MGLGEIAFIADYLAPLATHPAAFGLKDDAALLTDLPANGLVITADASVAGVHFFEDDDPGDAAYKALATNVSDLAAKAAKPIGYTLTLALAEAPSRDWAERFAAGLARAQNRFGIALLGGDTVTARGAWWMSITAFGEASPRGLVPRGGGGRRSSLCQRHARRRRARPSASSREGRFRGQHYRRRTATFSSSVTSTRNRGWTCRRPWQAMLRRRWTYRMGSRSTFRACAPRHRYPQSRGCPQFLYRRRQPPP